MLKQSIAGIVLFLIPMMAWAEFQDIRDHRFRSYIEELQSNGVVQGYGPGIFRPDLRINRAEFLKMTMLARFGAVALPPGLEPCFIDFSGQEQWYWTYACAAKKRGLVEGYPDGAFRGESTVNLSEALAVAIRAWNIPLPYYVREPDHWYDPYIDVAAGRDLFALLPQHAAHSLTRGEAAALLVSLGEEIAQHNPDAFPIQTPEAKPALCGNGLKEFLEECDDGNLANGDGCSEICVTVPEPIRHAALRIEQKSTGSETAAVGTRGLTLLRFEAVSGRQDAILTGLLFKAENENLTDATNYRLLFDADQNGVPEKNIAQGKVDAGTLAFDGFTAALPDGRLSAFSVVGDLTRSGGSNDLRLGFRTDNARYVVAIGDKDGRELSGIETDAGGCLVTSICWIAVQTIEAGTISRGEKGNLYVVKDAAFMRSRQLLLGSVTDALFGLVMRADGEDIAVTALRIGGGAESIDRLELFEKAGSSPVILRALDCSPAAAGKFCASSKDGLLTILRGTEKNFILKAVMKSDENGGVSGQTVTFTVSASTLGDIAVTARGIESDAELSQNDGDDAAEGEVFIGRNSAGQNFAITGATHDVVAAKIIEIANANPDPNGTPVRGATQAFGQFRLRAAPHGNAKNGLDRAVITDIVFTVHAENVRVIDLKLSNKADPSLKANCTGSSTTGNFTVTCSDLETTNVSTAIDQGSFIELALEGNVALTDGFSSRILQASLNELGDPALAGAVSWKDDVSAFEWVDIPETLVRSTVYRMP